MTRADLIDYMRRDRSATDEEVALLEALIDAMDRVSYIADIIDRIDRETARLSVAPPGNTEAA